MYGQSPNAGAGQAIFTDDVSLQVFMEYLKRLVRRKSSLPITTHEHRFAGCRSANQLMRCIVINRTDPANERMLCFLIISCLFPPLLDSGVRLLTFPF